MRRLNTLLTDNNIRILQPGEEVLLSGTIYTGRDQAHKRLAGIIKSGKALPVELRGAVIYYCGPTGTPKGKAIGSCGPTTASRMDGFSPLLIAAGLKLMIGKGNRGQEVVNAIKKHKGAYFVTYAGCGALLSKFILKAKPVFYPELGAEAIYKLQVKDFPLIVAIDSTGKNIYKKV
ncbi:MAG: FumA C-terminus/TtdB family hydratase beta subunit [Candidatus Omnitrophota bacterium]|jgi:fumarate hydratase subunit beta